MCFDSGRRDRQPVAGQPSGPSFRHLRPAGVAGAQEKQVHCVHSCVPDPAEDQRNLVWPESGEFPHFLSGVGTRSASGGIIAYCDDCRPSYIGDAALAWLSLKPIAEVLAIIPSPAGALDASLAPISSASASAIGASDSWLKSTNGSTTINRFVAGVCGTEAGQPSHTRIPNAPKLIITEAETTMRRASRCGRRGSGSLSRCALHASISCRYAYTVAGRK